jgi:phosphohistidine phosphatase
VTDPPPGGSDFDRVLAPRGRRDATALGRLFAGQGNGLGPALKRVPRPTVALVSPSARTMATAELVMGTMAEPPVLRFEEELYGADPEEVVSIVQGLDDHIVSTIVVGHNPTAHSLSQALLSPRGKGLALAVRTGFPTCALGVYSFPIAHWADLDLGGGKLVDIMVPAY